MRVAVASGVIAALCACSPKHWVSATCNRSVAPARDAVVYVDNGGVVLRRTDGDHRVGFVGCLAGGKDSIRGIVALADGWSAFVFGYHVNGGNFFESGSVTDALACVVDFHSKSATAVDPGLLHADLRLVQPRAGTRTSWLYFDAVSDTLHVVDLKRSASTELPDAGKVFVELGTTTRTIRVNLEQTDPQHPIYRTTLTVSDYDASVWPPAITATKQIAVGGRADRVVISPDGKWAAYDGSPYYVGIESKGQIADLGLVDLTTGHVMFEKLAQPGHLHAADIVVRGGKPYVLVAARTDPYGTGDAATTSWLDPTGATVGAAKRTSSDNVQWLSAWSRVVVDETCDLDLTDLPLPSG